MKLDQNQITSAALSVVPPWHACPGVGLCARGIRNRTRPNSALRKRSAAPWLAHKAPLDSHARAIPPLFPHLFVSSAR